jgi:hypothetical protein
MPWKQSLRAYFMRVHETQADVLLRQLLRVRKDDERLRVLLIKGDVVWQIHGGRQDHGA